MIHYILLWLGERGGREEGRKKRDRGQNGVRFNGNQIQQEESSWTERERERDDHLLQVHLLRNE